MPDERAAYLRRLQEGIDQFGHIVQYVAGTPPWAYTVGLTAKGHPEVILLGLGPDSAKAILNDTAELLKEGRVQVGEPFELQPGGAPLMLLPVKPAEVTGEWFNVARAYYRTDDLRALQLVFSDPNHRFPWNPDVQEAYKTQQPLLCDPPALA